MRGFGIVHPLPGIADGFQLNTAITLPVGVEAYGAFALGAWLAPGASAAARKFARRSALGSLLLGMAGQVIYHLLAAGHAHQAPWPVVVLVSSLPVITLGFGAGLAHLLAAGQATADELDAEPHGGSAPAGDDAALGTGADSALDTSAANPADNGPGSSPDTRADVHPVSGPAARRTSRRTAGRTGTAAAVARLRARHPDMPAASIARRLGVSDRTVRRHLAARPAPVEPPSAAA